MNGEQSPVIGAGLLFGVGLVVCLLSAGLAASLSCKKKIEIKWNVVLCLAIKSLLIGLKKRFYSIGTVCTILIAKVVNQVKI